MQYHTLPLPREVSKTFIAFGRGRIYAHVGADPEFPADLRSESEKKSFLAGYKKEQSNPSIGKELERFPTQLSKRAIKAYNSNKEEMELLREMGWTNA